MSTPDNGAQAEVWPIQTMAWGCPFPGLGTSRSILGRPTFRVASHHAVHPLPFLWQEERKRPALALFPLWLPTGWAGRWGQAKGLAHGFLPRARCTACRDIQNSRGVEGASWEHKVHISTMAHRKTVVCWASTEVGDGQGSGRWAEQWWGGGWGVGAAECSPSQRHSWSQALVTEGDVGKRQLKRQKKVKYQT